MSQNLDFSLEFENYQKEQVELRAMEYEELKALNKELEIASYEPTPEDWAEYANWASSIEEVDLDKMYAYYFPNE